jgi:hypothetical protein
MLLLSRWKPRKFMQTERWLNLSWQQQQQQEEEKWP